MNISSLATPALLLDESRLMRNVARVHATIDRQPGVTLRAHLKTAKSIEVAERILRGPKQATVSTLREAEYFLAGGIADLLYGVGITPDKFGRVAALVDRGARMTVVVDDCGIAREAARWFAAARRRIAVMIEIDSDGHRSGVDPRSDQLVPIARALSESDSVEFAGVMTHAGASYDCTTIDEIVGVAAQERDGAVRAAEQIRAAGIRCAGVSVGSTPTILLGRDLTGVTEARVGVAFFNDLTMVGLGACALDDIALSVLTTVIGHQSSRNRMIIDAGWMALSADRGRASQRMFNGYGAVADPDGRLVPGLGVVGTNQEHGTIASASDARLPFERYPIGSRLRVLPNHACATAAAFCEYQVQGEDGEIFTRWSRCSGW